MKAKMKRKLIDSEYRRRHGISYSNTKYFKEENINIKGEESNKYTSMADNSQKTKKSNIPIRKKLFVNNLFLESEKNDLIKLYENDEKIKHKILPILNFNKINDCSIMKYGARKSSVEIEYSYCKTCDYNSLKPICLSCINKCHYGHIIKFIFKKGYIKCSCGEKNHMIMKINYKKTNNIKCLCNEWNSTANLRYYYINKMKEPICILCNYCCGNNNKKNIIKLRKNKIIPNCSCKNRDVHNDKRVVCDKLLNLISGLNDFDLLIHPIQFVNIIFMSKNNFTFLFECFDFFMNDLNNSKDNSHIIDMLSKMRRIDVEYSNIHKTLLILVKIIEKTGKNNIYFYNKEVIKFFSFDIIKKLLEVLMLSSIEEKLFWQLTNKFLYLFHKIYINDQIKLLNKFKLRDLKHLNFLIRIKINKENRKYFSESNSIISFLINFMIYINNKKPVVIEAIHCIKEIISIFRKFACYNLITNNNMVKICSNILESFNWIRTIKKYYMKNEQRDIKSKIDSYYFKNISIKAFFIIIKTLQNFIYNYNDNIIDMIINNKNNDIKLDNICFIFKKNDLGESIYKISIYILSTLEKDYKKNQNNRIILTQRLASEIINYALIDDDNYLLNLIDSFYKFKTIYSIENNKYCLDLLKQTKLISNTLHQYFNFDKSIEEALNIINDSLNIILGDKKLKNIASFNIDKEIINFDTEQVMAIFCTNYYFLISKAIGIMYNHQTRKKESEKKENNEILNELFDYIKPTLEDEISKKILLFFFSLSINSEDFSFVILSHYIFKELIKLQKKYCHILFKLSLLCIKNIFESGNHTIKKDSSFLIKRLYNYLDELMNSHDKIDNNTLMFCVNEFLQILELAVLNCEDSLFNVFIYKIQYLIIIIGKNYKLVKKYFELENDEHFMNKTNGINIYKKAFSTYMKLINDCFDFSVEEDRKNITEIIDINEIIYALENYKLNINIKTEFMRYIRKYMIDLKYKHKENGLYIFSIINNEDNLEEIKDNSLLYYSNYTTKLISFLKDLYSITAISSFEEKLEEKRNEQANYRKIKRNSNIRNWVIEKRGNNEINISNEVSDLGETKLEHSGFFEEYKNDSLIYSTNNENILNNHYLGEHKLPKIIKENNSSKLLEHLGENTPNKKKIKLSRLSLIIPREKKKIMNIYIPGNLNEDDLSEREIDKNDLKILKELIKQNNYEMLYDKMKEMYFLEDIFNIRFYNIINKEFDEVLQKKWKLNDDNKISSFKNYIENGLLIPVIFYFKKIIIMIHILTGIEMIQLFSLLEKCLRLKIFLYENYNNIWINNENEEKEENSFLFTEYNYSNNKGISIIDHAKFENIENKNITKEFLNIIQSNKISVYDYTSLYHILEIELFSLIKEKKAKIFNYKKDKEDALININNLNNYTKKDFAEIEVYKRLCKSIILYKNSKILCNNDNNSSFLSILSELNLEFEINFRNILLSIIIKRGKDINIKNEYMTISYYLLLKLLYLQTEETQSEIINIINKNENNLLKDLSEILNNKMILSIIEYINPSDGLIHSNYFISYNILSIFKYLCSKTIFFLN